MKILLLCMLIWHKIKLNIVLPWRNVSEMSKTSAVGAGDPTKKIFFSVKLIRFGQN